MLAPTDALRSSRQCVWPCCDWWPIVINMELMLWTPIVVYFDNNFTFTRLRVCLTRMPPRHRPQLRHGSRRDQHCPRLRHLLCDCKYVVCSAVIGSPHDKAHSAENKLYFYNKYRVSHNTGLTFFVFFLSVYFHPKCRSWGSFEKFRKFANLFAF